MRRIQKQPPLEHIVPRVKVWIEVDGSYVLGRGISDILKAVASTGSMKDAAESLGKSYRYVWNRIKAAESALGATLVETHVGGKDAHRSDVTELGQLLVEEFDRLRSKMTEILEQEFPDRLAALIRKKSIVNPKAKRRQKVRDKGARTS